MNQALSAKSPAPSITQVPKTDRMAQAVAQEMERVNQRYLLPLDRFAAAARHLPPRRVVQVIADADAGFFVLAIVIDGQIVRILRPKEFKLHDPEWFALHAFAFVLLACTNVFAFVVPMTIASKVLETVPIAGAFFLSRIIANFHRRG